MADLLLKTLIIDDEEPARIYLKELLQLHSDFIEIVGEAVNGIEAVTLIESLKPDLIFLDIQMPGKNGFEMLQDLTKIPIIVFCTAYDEYALDAFETNCTDYLVKPVKAERLKKTIEKLKGFNNRYEQPNIKELIQTIIQSNIQENPTSFPVKTGDRVVFLKIKEIVYFMANEKYVEIHTIQNKVFILDQSLNLLEKKLPSQFLRLHKGQIVNTNLIKEIKKYSPGHYLIVLDDICNTKIISGRKYSMEVNRLMKI